MALLDNLTPEQQLKLLSTQNKNGNTALHCAAQEGKKVTQNTLVYYDENLVTITTLEQYQIEADFRVFRKFAILFINFVLCMTLIHVILLDYL